MTRRYCFWSPNHIDAPPLVRVDHENPQPYLILSGRSPTISRQIWALIQKERPAMADLLASAWELVEAFDCDVSVAIDDLPESVINLTRRSPHE